MHPLHDIHSRRRIPAWFLTGCAHGGDEADVVRAAVRRGVRHALGSRNRYLQAAERAEALMLGRRAQSCARCSAGRRARLRKTRADVDGALAVRGWQPDYIAVRECSNLLPVGPQDASAALVLLAAARLGATHLIGNLEI